jgi:regulator of replication initiation timing
MTKSAKERERKKNHWIYVLGFHWCNEKYGRMIKDFYFIFGS